METRSNTFVIASETAWQDLGGGVQRQILGYDGQLMLVKVKFEKGAVGAPHKHYHSQSTLVVSGVFEFTVGDEKRVVRRRRRHIYGPISSTVWCASRPECFSTHSRPCAPTSSDKASVTKSSAMKSPLTEVLPSVTDAVLKS